MTADEDTAPKRSRRPVWIAAGFILAFAASVSTVIYTGLMVEGSRSEFDTGFRSVTLTVAERTGIDLVFESPTAIASAELEIVLPDAVGFVDRPDLRRTRRPVVVDAGRNTFAVEIVALSPGSGYVSGRISDEPIPNYRVFVTVVED